MLPPPMRRHVAWSTTLGWNTFLVDCGDAPDAAINWIDANLSGPWSFRTLSPTEYEAEYNRPYDGRFVLEFAIRNDADADKLFAHFAKPAGGA